MTDKLADHWKALAQDTDKLGDAKFLQVFKLLEQLGEKTDLRSALDLMRPRLATLKLPRRLSMSRLFFRPVEDLMDNPDSYTRKINRVSRAILGPAWNAVKEFLDKNLQDSISAKLTTTDARDEIALIEVGKPLWPAGAAAIEKVAQRAQNDMKYRLDLFGRDDDVLRQLDTIRQVCLIGLEIEELKVKLPERPIGELAESHSDAIKLALGEVGKENAKRATPMLLVLTSRMMKPGELLKMLAEVRMGGDANMKDELTHDLSGYVVSNLLRQTSEMEREVEAAAEGEGKLESLAASAERLAEGLNSVNETVQQLRDSAMNERVNAAKAEIGNFVMRNIVADVDKNIMALLQAPASEDGMPDDERLVQAENFALALRRSTKLAPFLGINKEVASKVEQLKSQIGQETSALKKSGGDPE